MSAAGFTGHRYRARFRHRRPGRAATAVRTAVRLAAPVGGAALALVSAALVTGAVVLVLP